jgi:peptide/nickel transport system substrate-binding protein
MGRGGVPDGFMPALLGGRTGGPALAYDLARAAAHFKKAWGGRVWKKGFRFTLSSVEGSDQSIAIYQMIKRGVESLNPRFRIDLRVVQRSTSADLVRKRKSPMTLASWRADFPDPHNVAYAFMHSQGYFPWQQGWKDPEADALVERAAAEADPRKRAADYARLQAIADERVHHAPYAYVPRYRTQRTWVKGYVHRPDYPSPQISYFYDLYKGD